MKNKIIISVCFLFLAIQTMTLLSLIEARHRIQYLEGQNEITGNQIESIGQDIALIGDELNNVEQHAGIDKEEVQP